MVFTADSDAGVAGQRCFVKRNGVIGQFKGDQAVSGVPDLGRSFRDCFDMAPGELAGGTERSFDRVWVRWWGRVAGQPHLVCAMHDSAPHDGAHIEGLCHRSDEHRKSVFSG